MDNKVLFITDTYKDLNVKKDTSILMIEEAIKNQFNVFQCEIDDLFIENNYVWASARNILSAGSTQVEGILKENIKVSEFKYSFMRKDPPVDENYINALHLLGHAEKQGAVIFNKPNSIKEFNEKIFALYFKEYIPKTLITSKLDTIKEFIDHNKTIIVKPLDGMGGTSIHKIDQISEKNINLLNEMTNIEKTQIICQEFIEDIYEGDYRILIINGKPFKKTLARIPQGESFKGNLAAGGSASTIELNEQDKIIAQTVADKMLDFGLYIVGLDMIGNFLTEIYLTSPTCFRELKDQADENLAKLFVDELFGH